MSTDLVTRLSLESVKQSNLRMDAISCYDNKEIAQCMLDLEYDEKELLQVLKKIHSNPDEQLFRWEGCCGLCRRLLWMRMM